MTSERWLREDPFVFVYTKQSTYEVRSPDRAVLYGYIRSIHDIACLGRWVALDTDGYWETPTCSSMNEAAHLLLSKRPERAAAVCHA